MPFVRAATAGQWKSRLSAPLVQRIEAAWWPVMRSLGYNLASTGREVKNSTDLAFLDSLGAVPILEK